MKRNVYNFLSASIPYHTTSAYMLSRGDYSGKKPLKWSWLREELFAESENLDNVGHF